MGRYRVQPVTVAHPQAGLALISVLLMLTLGILLASAMSEKLQLLVRSSAGLQNKEQAYLYSLSAEQLAIKGLTQDFKDDPGVTHLAQYWATPQSNMPVGSGTMSGQVRDRQSCFNLNALSHPDRTQKNQPLKTHRTINVFTALLENVGVDPMEAAQIAQATRDWVYPRTQEVSHQGADDDYYLSLPVAYLASNTDMRDESEWRAVRGVRAAISQRLLPYLCTIPEHELRINVNTIDVNQPELLAALFENELSVGQAKDVLEDRPREGWKNVDAFLEQSALSGLETADAAKSLTVKSFYFELSTLVDMQETSVRLQSLMVRGKNNKLTVIRRRAEES